MAEYINRTELIENLNKFAPEYYNALINQLITKLPAADVVEVKHGKWYNYRSVVGEKGFQCSLCGRVEHEKEPYCNCGAKMR